MTEPTVELKPVDQMTIDECKQELDERGYALDGIRGRDNFRAAVEKARAPEPDEPDEIEVEPTADEAEQEAHAATDLAVQEPTAVARQSFTERERELISRLVAPGHTPDELALFERICIRTGLDPFARQIYSIKRQRNRKLPNGQWIKEEVATPQTSIDGFRLIAHRTGRYAGQTPPEWCGDDGRWVDVWLSDKPPSAARIGVFRQGFAIPLQRTVTWREFGADTPTWKKMPALMLAKVAESQSLRAAFPQELSGIYTEEEMSQASGDAEIGYQAIGASPVKQDAPVAPPPRSVAEIVQRLGRVVGEDEAVEWLRQAAVEWATTQHASVSSFSELSPALQTTLGQKLAGVVIDLEERESETGDDLRMSTDVRQKVAAVFGKRLDGVALTGPPWRLGPDEQNLPTHAEHVARKDAPTGDHHDAGDEPLIEPPPGEDIEFPADGTES